MKRQQLEAFPHLRINVKRVKRNRKAIRIVQRMLSNIGGRYIKNKPFSDTEFMTWGIEYPYNKPEEKRDIESRIVTACDKACDDLKLDHLVINRPELGYTTVIEISSEFTGNLRFVQVK